MRSGVSSATRGATRTGGNKRSLDACAGGSRGLCSKGRREREYKDRSAAAEGSWPPASAAEGPFLPPAAAQRPHRMQADLSGPVQAVKCNGAGPQLNA